MQELVTMSPWEGVAVVLAIAYLLLAVREHPACWGCALGSTVIYTALFWNVSLLMESLLNVYYMLMAVYGWWLWQRGGLRRCPPAITRWHLRRHLLVIGAVLAAAAVTGALLSRHTAAAWPYVDSFTTWGAIVTTWMVARKVLENWLYWLVIDGVSIPLYVDRGLYLTATLFAVYLVIVVFGFRQWRREYVASRAAVAAA
ncbi:MAG: nicotinamide riboside transporter PnuC [Gammaproteobacteria bacterium]